MDPDNLPNHVVILTKHSQLLRTTLADRIEIVARTLHGSFVVTSYQLKNILETAAQQPENGVSVLIDIIKGSQDHFYKFIQCLSDLEYEGLVRKLQGTGSAAVGTTDKVPRTITDNTVPSPLTSWGTQPKPPVQYGRLPDTNRMDPFETNTRLDFSEPDFPGTIINNTAPLPTMPWFRPSLDQVVRGKMDKNHLTIWRKERNFLLSEFAYDIIFIEALLYRHHIIDDIDKQDIERESRTPEGDANGAKKLLEILENRGKNVLPRIIKALKAINHEVGDYLQARINGSKKRKRGIVNTT